MNILPDKIVFPERTLMGAGRAKDLLTECARYGRRGLLVHGRSLATHGVLKSLLQNPPSGMAVATWEHGGGEPALADLDRLLETARKHQADWIAGIGGGSVLDLAKASAGLFHAPQPPEAYHNGAAIETPGLAFAAVPTTAGTGSEATVNAVLTNSATRYKKSIRDDTLMARLVILDPALLQYCPKRVIAYAGMDAFTQALEAFTSRHAVWLSDELGLKALTLIGTHLEVFYRGADPAAAEQVLMGSYLAGLSFAIARLGVVHGIAHPLGVRYHVPHGYVCGVCLPHAVELNRDAMGGKYEQVSRALGRDLLDLIRHLLIQLDMPSPFRGKPIIEKEAIIRETVAAWSTQANPKLITSADVAWLLDRLFLP
ncbi:MAG: iron-containing alcohol dehydrogenase [Kiritimatiellota bacterium]|nr:iron-containing alcohol dehydrogenase [Kiritimatiellota bacterium]